MGYGKLSDECVLHMMVCALQEQLRKLIIEMVLATDMKQHFAIHGLFQSKVTHHAQHNATTTRASVSNMASNMTSTSGVLRLGSADSAVSNSVGQAAASHPQQHGGHHAGPSNLQTEGGASSGSGSGSSSHPQAHQQQQSGKPPIPRTTSNGGALLPTPAWTASGDKEGAPAGPPAASSPNSGPLQSVSSKDASCLSSASFLARSLRAAQHTARVSQEDEELKSLHLQVSGAAAAALGRGCLGTLVEWLGLSQVGRQGCG